MVKGNAQRRIELAERRKAESAEEKERRAAGALFATPAEARARLLHDARGAEGRLLAWVTAEGPSLCESWFRTGACPLRRCRHAHTDTISLLRGVPPVPGAPPPVPASRLTAPARSHRSDGGRSVSASRLRSASASRTRSVSPAASGGAHEGAAGEGAAASRDHLPALAAVPLRGAEPGGSYSYDRAVRTQVRAEWRLHFIEYDGTLVFDIENAFVWAGYCEARAAAAAASAAAAAAATTAAAAAAAANTPDSAVTPDALADGVAAVALGAGKIASALLRKGPDDDARPVSPASPRLAARVHFVD
jgi:hypothetical protein